MPKSETNSFPSFKDTDRSQIQGFVTSGYGHMVFTAYLFLRLREESEVARRGASQWLGGLLEADQITTARTWRVRKGKPKAKPDWAVNVAFTHAGLKAWGLDEGTLNSFSPEFVEGAAAPKRAEVLGDTGDSAPKHWEFGGRRDGQGAIHCVVVVHAVTEKERGKVLDWLQVGLDEYGSAIEEAAPMQPGQHLIHLDPVRGDRVVKEHFGFNDGVSQPAFRGLGDQETGQPPTAPGEFVLGYPDEYDFYPTTPLTHRDRDSRALLHASPYEVDHPDHRDFGYNGTYLVYRKLAQDVAGFWNQLRDQCRELFGNEEPRSMLWLAAKMVGRWPNGVPLVEAPDLVDMSEFCGKQNEFLFAKPDPDGSACPFASHIRRANPRDQLKPGSPEQSLNMTARHRILRRGSTYGEPLFDLGILDNPNGGEVLELLRRLKDDGRERGLHFLCLNANIRRQFEFVQQSWSVSRTFNALRDDPDPIIGNADGNGCFTIPGNPDSLRMKCLSSQVHTRAAAYFFVPGMRALRYLAELNQL